MISRLERDRAGGYDRTEVTGIGDLTMQPITTTSGFIADMQGVSLLRQPLQHFVYIGSCVLNRAVGSDCSVTAFFCYGYGNCFFMDIQSNKSCVHRSSPYKGIAPTIHGRAVPFIDQLPLQAGMTVNIRSRDDRGRAVFFGRRLVSRSDTQQTCRHRSTAPRSAGKRAG